MLKLGAGTVKSLYAGERKVKQAYLGEKQVFTTKISRLPAGYTEVEYVQTSGYATFNTGIKPYSNKIKLEIDAAPLSLKSGNNYGYFFESRYDYAGSKLYYEFYARILSSNAVNGMLHGAANVALPAEKTLSSSVPFGTRVTISGDYNTKSMSLGSTTVKFSYSGTTSSMPNIVLLGSSTTANASSYYLNARLYSCKIEAKGVPARDYVPCINPSGKAGLYDLVNGTFLAHTGTGTVTAGPAV